MSRYINNKMRELDFTVNDVLDVSGMSTRRIIPMPFALTAGNIWRSTTGRYFRIITSKEKEVTVKEKMLPQEHFFYE